MLSNFPNPFFISDEAYAVLMNMTELAMFKSTTKRYIEEQGENASQEMIVLNTLLESTFETTCLWVSKDL